MFCLLKKLKQKIWKINQEGVGGNNILSVKSFHNYVEDTKIYNEDKYILQKDISYRNYSEIFIKTINIYLTY